MHSTMQHDEKERKDYIASIETSVPAEFGMRIEELVLAGWKKLGVVQWETEPDDDYAGEDELVPCDPPTTLNELIATEQWLKEISELRKGQYKPCIPRISEKQRNQLKKLVSTLKLDSSTEEKVKPLGISIPVSPTKGIHVAIGSGKSISKSAPAASHLKSLAKMKKRNGSTSSNSTSSLPLGDNLLNVPGSSSPESNSGSPSRRRRSTSCLTPTIYINPSYAKLFSKIPISCLNEPKKIICLKDSMSLATALDTLATHRILSAPVVHHRTSVIIGYLDVLDISQYILSVLTANDKDYLKYVFGEGTVGNVIDGRQFVPLRENDTLLRLMQMMAVGVHKVVLTNNLDDPNPDNDNRCNKEDELIGILSQASLIELGMKEFKDIFDRKKDSSIEKLKMFQPRENIVAVDRSIPTWICVHLMCKYKISSVAIIDYYTQRLVATISLENIKGINTRNFHLLWKPAIEFVRLMEEEVDGGGVGGEKGLVFCEISTNLGDVMKNMMNKNTSRIWVVNNFKEKKLIGLVTMTDILRMIVGSSEEDRKRLNNVRKEGGKREGRDKKRKKKKSNSSSQSIPKEKDQVGGCVESAFYQILKAGFEKQTSGKPTSKTT